MNAQDELRRPLAIGGQWGDRAAPLDTDAIPAVQAELDGPPVTGLGQGQAARRATIGAVRRPMEDEMDLEKRIEFAEKRAEALEHLVFAQELALKVTINALLGAFEALPPRDKTRADALREYMAGQIEKSISKFPNEPGRAVMLRSYAEWLRHSLPDDLPTPHFGGVLQ